ncbi:hypothetical protein ACQZ48_04440 [Agrobacterium sp. 22-209-1]
MRKELIDAMASARLAPSGLMYRLRMHDVGQQLVSSTLEEEKNASKQFHVVCPVEDFEGIGSGVRGELTRFGNVSYSCVWSQFERMSTEPLIEVCPIYKAYHQPKPQEKYTLVIACANVGSTTPLVSILTHMICDRGFEDYERVQIMAPVVNINAKAELKRRISLKEVEWSPAQLVTAFEESSARAPGASGDPITREGFSSARERLHYLPDEIRADRDRRREQARELRLQPGQTFD